MREKTAPSPKYIARLVGVRELALLGAAELAWWRDQLAFEGLDPILAGLRASRFRPIQWHLRPSATHARSKTLQIRCSPR